MKVLNLCTAFCKNVARDPPDCKCGGYEEGADGRENQKCKFFQKQAEESVISRSEVHLTQANAQYAINCTFLGPHLRNACQLQSEEALSEVRKRLGKGRDPGVAQKSSASPTDIGVAKT